MPIHTDSREVWAKAVSCVENFPEVEHITSSFLKKLTLSCCHVQDSLRRFVGVFVNALTLKPYM